jgi:hypothetical protein
VTVTINETGIQAFFNSTVGPWGRHLALLSDMVLEKANINASGPVIGIETGRLVGGLRVQLEGTAEGAQAIVGTDAVAYDAAGGVRTYRGRPFSYPAYHDQNTGRPWMSNALREVFPG